ncbi:PLP-dependent transferase [Xylona heveae TC161]|uniref:PLP-dependent transferase n=1 Tax=Xylona heveae (strain CBS 132557 / TC161) TaxID=1328760 RepID=A0A165HZ79_XYLHT|nr:PLP-dependent transferase [Xylona heveae TC161]KZF24125.1 PLP-dependent transferase [Xylona heveae TC161]
MVAAQKPLINLLRGWPNPKLLPAPQLKTASQSVLSNPDVFVPGLQYGPDPGYEPLREQIASWLHKYYLPLEQISPERICITGGASQNLACILQVFTDPVYTRNIWMVAPTYFLACRIFEDSGFHGRLRAVPEDKGGIDLDFLRRGLRESEKRAELEGNNVPKLKPNRPWARVYRHIIYAVPTFSNPSSITMSLQHREELVRLAREFDALIITDDVYDHLQWAVSVSAHSSGNRDADHAILPRIVDVDRRLEGGAERSGSHGFGNAVSNGSFSKIVAPGSRTGWAEGTPKFAFGLSQTGSSRSGGAPSQLASTFIADMLASGELQKHIRNVLRPAYAARYRRMLLAIERYLLPLGVTMAQPDRDVVGGYFIWFDLPNGLDADLVARRAMEMENVIIAEGSLFEVSNDAKGARFPSAVRVCFSWEEEDCLAEGIERLANVVRCMLNGECSDFVPSDNNGSSRDQHR